MRIFVELSGDDELKDFEKWKSTKRTRIIDLDWDAATIVVLLRAGFTNFEDIDGMSLEQLQMVKDINKRRAGIVFESIKREKDLRERLSRQQ